MLRMCDADNFYEYLIQKYFVFSPLAELDEANTIDDISIIKRDISNTAKRLKDNDMIDLGKQVFEKFLCYDIGTDITNRKTSSDVEDIYKLYKLYKCSNSNRTRERETSLELDITLDTNDTQHVDFLETVTTHQLQKVFGEYVHSGGSEDWFRYEYRFRFTMDGKVYKFSLYDYLNEDGEFYNDHDIYWHVAANTDKPKIITTFLKSLEQTISQYHDDCC